MSPKQEESIECFAFVPIQKFEAMEQKIKKAKMAQSEPPPYEPPEPPASATLKKEVHSVAPSQPDLKHTFCTAQMKKLFHLIQNNNPSQDILSILLFSCTGVPLKQNMLNKTPNNSSGHSQQLFL